MSSPGLPDADRLDELASFDERRAKGGLVAISRAPAKLVESISSLCYISALWRSYAVHVAMSAPRKPGAS